MAELLLEVLSEEIPARMQTRAAADFARVLRRRLEAAALACEGAEGFATPRRLAAVARGVPLRQPDTKEERRGPRVGAPERALRGFLRSAGLDSPERCERRETAKGAFWFAVIERRGRRAVEVLPEVVRATVADMPWPKSMRWGAARLRWVRPLRSVLCVFDGEAVPGALPLGGKAGALAFADSTVGHTRGRRGSAPARLAVSSFADYRAKLEAAGVVLDPAERARRIVAEGRRLAGAAGLGFDPDPALLEEAAGLVEWPTPLPGSIDDAFMRLPPEVLATAMMRHQKYFPLSAADGTPANRFVMVADGAPADGGAAVRAGNERVLRARLHDAAFFWDGDRRVPLESRTPMLDRMAFHARLGSVGDKRRRLEAFGPAVAEYVPGADGASVARAARLCKADLVTDMVGEFAGLQGVMGRYYALHDGEAAAVADAIAEHYAPAGSGDECPRKPVSVALALADRLDTLAGFFAIGERPTGSKDPFALRRAALGAVRLVLDNALRVPLRGVLETAAAGHGAEAPGAAATEALDFIAERLRVHMREGGLRHDAAAAVFAASGDDDLLRLRRRAAALADFLATGDGADLLAAFRRAANILRIEERKDGARHDGPVAAAALAEPAESALCAGLDRAERDIADALGAERFDAAMRALALLRAPVDRFFEEVTVNAESAELRANRLRLLSRVRSALAGVADFARIEGGTSA